MVKKINPKNNTEPHSPDLSESGTIGKADCEDSVTNVMTPEPIADDTSTTQASEPISGVEPDLMDIITAERDTLKDQLLRALADTENMRRRSEREAETARKYGHTQFARDLVGAIDNLSRALESAPEDKTVFDEPVQSLLTGIELSWTEIQTAIEKHGVRQINPLGERFDYNFHQAMFEVPTNEQPAGVVLEVVQHGYALYDRLLRPAMVGVSKAVDTNEGKPAEK